MIGKILADRWGWTEKLGGTKNEIVHITTEVNQIKLDKLIEDIKKCNTTAQVDVVIKEHGFSNIEGLPEHIKEFYEKGEIDKLNIGDVNKFAINQRYTDIANQAHGIIGVKKAIDEYNESLIKNVDDTTKASESTNKFITTLSVTNPKLADCMKNAKGGSIGMRDYAKSLATATLKTIGLHAATTLMNAAVSLGVSALIDLAISGISYLINYEEKQKEAFENAKSATEDCVNAIKKLKKEMSDTSAKASSLSSEFAELVQGVNPLTNENVSLSTESYERFLEVNNQLAELFPSLTKNYDENGNAILGLSESVDSVTASIERLVEQQNNLAKAKMRESLEDYINGDEDNGGIFKVLEGQKKAVKEAEKELALLKEVYDNLIINPQDVEIEGVTNFDDYFEVIDKYFGKDIGDLIYSYTSSISEPQSYAKWHIDYTQLKLDNKTKDEIIESYNTFFNDLSTTLEIKKSELEAKNQEMSSMMMIWIEDLDFYKDKKGNPEFQKFIENLVNNLDWSSFDIKDGDFDAAKQLIQQIIINPLTKACKNPNTKTEIMNALSELLSFDFSKLNYKDAEKKIRGLLTIIMDIINEDVPKDKKKSLDDMYDMFGMNDYKDIDSRMENNIVKIADKGTADYKTLTEYTKNFKQAQAEAWLEATNGAKNAQDAIKKYKNSLNNAKPISFTDAISQVESLSKGFDQLDKIYADVSNKEDFDWGSMLNNEDFKNTFGKLDGYDDFIKTISNSSDDIDACQDSFNRLATAYINSTDAMKGLSTETQNATVEMLKQMGIANAQEVVTARLAAQEAFLAEAKENNKIASEDLESATWQEIATLLAEGEASDTAKSYLWQLLLTKYNINDHPINTEEDVTAICDIANAAGSSAEYVTTLRTALERLQKFQSMPSRMWSSMEDYYADKEELENDVNTLFTELQANIEKVKIDPNDFITKYKGGSKTKSEMEKAAKEAEKAFNESYNWIETAINRIERLISRLKTKAESIYKTWTSRNNNLREEISAVRNEIELQQRAYERYMQQADSIGLSADWAEKVRNGKVDIETVTDEDLSNKIKEYQEW